MVRGRGVATFVAVGLLSILPGCLADEGAEEESVETESAFAADACTGKAAVCGGRSAAEGKGLVAIDRCAFPLGERGFAANAVLSALDKITTRASLAAVLDDANNTGKATTRVPGSPAGVVRAFGWENDDATTKSWIPQGITGSADATGGAYEGRKVILSSWYNDDKGVRIAVIDATGADAKYRFAMLVEPSGTAAAPSFRPVKIHAGGLAWVGSLLYVVDTTGGFRVFDMNRIMKVGADATKAAIGCTGGTCKAYDYRYVIPQIGTYTDLSKCSQRFSFVSVDRSTSPPSLISGEYCDGKACPKLGGRVFRYELAANGRINRAYPTNAYLMGQAQVQGAAARNGTFYLSSSAPAGGAGALYTVKPGAAKTHRWSDTPEDVMVDGQNGLLYSQTENAPRVVFATKLSSYGL